MNERVIMPRASRWISDDDVRFTTDAPRMGTRFYLDVSDEALARIGAEGVAHAVQRLGEAIAFEHRADITRAVHDILLDREWAEPIIRDEISKNVRRIMDEMFIPPDTEEGL